ncbi:MAG: hypothetical protein J6Y33_03275 [Prevotella sp.]|nr:hypothetical protein [Prevotella sp.]
MAGDKPVGFAKEGMLTYNTEDDGSTKDSGAWERPMRHSYEITGKAVVSEVGDTIRELLEGAPRKVDVEIRREMGKMPRKMKKAHRTGSRYRRDTKWKRKAKAYERRFVYRLTDAEIVVTRQQMGVLEATIKGGSLQRDPDAVACVSGKNVGKTMAEYVRRKQSKA